MSRIFDFLVRHAELIYQSRRDTIISQYGYIATSFAEVAKSPKTEAKASKAQTSGVFQDVTAQSKP